MQEIVESVVIGPGIKVFLGSVHRVAVNLHRRTDPGMIVDTSSQKKMTRHANKRITPPRLDIRPSCLCTYCHTMMTASSSRLPTVIPSRTDLLFACLTSCRRERVIIPRGSLLTDLMNAPESSRTKSHYPSFIDWVVPIVNPP